MSISTHVLDTSTGRPAAGLPVVLELRSGDQWRELFAGRTDADGRIGGLVPKDSPMESGTYRVTFDTHSYFDAAGTQGFYPYAAIAFTVRDPEQHHHVPLLLSPFGYSTYRGS